MAVRPPVPGRIYPAHDVYALSAFERAPELA
jgi:hypothetical protein